MSRQRDQSPGAKSVDSAEDMSMSRGRSTREGREIGGSIMGAAPPRQSIARGMTPAGIRHSRDPRPIGDKSYAMQCARNVVDFVTDRGIGRTIFLDKFLREPMHKEVFEIFKFLMAQLDPKLEIEGKMEDEVPVIMKRLKYPTEVIRSKLQAISGPNTWPQLLAMFDWLVTLIQVNDELIVPVAECQMGLASASNVEAEDGDHCLLRTLHRAYYQFLTQDKENDEEDRLKQIYEERIQACTDEIERLQDQQASMDKELQEFRAEHERLQELKSAPQQLELEADSLRGVIRAQDARVQRNEEDVAMIEVDEGKVLGEIEKLEGHVRRLQEQVEGQAYSKLDIERLKCERSHLRSMHEDLRTETERAEANVFDLQMQERSLEEAIGRTSRGVNDVAEVVESAVSSAGGPSGQELFVRVDLSESTDALASLDFGEASRRVQAANASLVEVAQREEAGINEVLEEQRVAQEELSEKERQINQQKTRLEQQKRMREECKVHLATQLDDGRRTAEEWENSVRQQSISTAAPSMRDAAEVDELRLRISALKTSFAGDKLQLEEQLRRAQERGAELRQIVTKELKSTHEALDKVKGEVERSAAEVMQGVQGPAADATDTRPRSARTVAHGGC